MSSDRLPKLVSLFFWALILLNFPIIGIFGKAITIAGIPLLYLYVFGVWILIIIFIIPIIHQKH